MTLTYMSYEVVCSYPGMILGNTYPIPTIPDPWHASTLCNTYTIPFACKAYTHYSGTVFETDYTYTVIFVSRSHFSLHCRRERSYLLRKVIPQCYQRVRLPYAKHLSQRQGRINTSINDLRYLPFWIAWHRLCITTLHDGRKEKNGRKQKETRRTLRTLRPCLGCRAEQRTRET